MSFRSLVQLLVAFFPFGKRAIYRLVFGAKIGKRVRIGFGAVLLFDEMELGEETKIAPFTYLNVKKVSTGVRATIGRFTQISVNVLRLGPSSTIASQVSIKGDPSDPRSVLAMGAECWIFEYCYLNVARPIHMGRNVGVGGGTYIFTHGYWLSQLHGYPVSYGSVVIGNDVWLPWGCFIFPGVEIGDGAVIGARSVVNKSVPEFSLVAGSPAKVIREKVNANVSVEQRVEMLISTTMEFCSYRCTKLGIVDLDGWTVLSIDGVRQIAIATTAKVDLEHSAVRDLLKVVHEPLSKVDATNSPLFSTESFQCTPRHSFNKFQAAWLNHLRSIGTRHYPIDEVEIE